MKFRTFLKALFEPRLVRPSAVLLLSLLFGPAVAANMDDDDWFISGQTAVEKRFQYKPNTNRAKNVILFIGDGMGVSTITAARIFDGQSKGGLGEENVLSFETFPNLALVKTYNTNQQVADSAGTASAMNTGIKTRAGVLGITGKARRANCQEGLENIVPTLGEIAEHAGIATGIVTTARLTHATPAAVYAHSAERDWEADKDISKENYKLGCRSIARQFVEFGQGNGIDVALGGGREEFSPDLIESWTSRYPAGALVESASGLKSIGRAVGGPVLGLFSPSHMTYMLDRKAETIEPTLSDMTDKAIDVLEAKGTGYFLMVEGGRIDHGHHDGRAGYALTEAQEFARAVQVALSKVNLEETLILVTADHSHVFTMAGYGTRGNPILGLSKGNDKQGEPTGTPILALDGKAYTTLGYQNGPGAVSSVRETPETGLYAIQQALIPTGYHSGTHPKLSESHAGEDVALFATGPRAYLVSGVMEQNVIFHIITNALELPHQP